MALGATCSNSLISLGGMAGVSYGAGLMYGSFPGLFKTTCVSETQFRSLYAINYSINNAGAMIGQYALPLALSIISYSQSYAISCTLSFAGIIILLSQKASLVETGGSQSSQRKFRLFLGVSFLSIVGIFTLYFKPFAATVCCLLFRSWLLNALCHTHS